MVMSADMMLTYQLVLSKDRPYRAGYGPGLLLLLPNKNSPNKPPMMFYYHSVDPKCSTTNAVNTRTHTQHPTNTAISSLCRTPVTLQCRRRFDTYVHISQITPAPRNVLLQQPYTSVGSAMHMPTSQPVLERLSHTLASVNCISSPTGPPVYTQIVLQTKLAPTPAAHLAGHWVTLQCICCDLRSQLAGRNLIGRDVLGAPAARSSTLSLTEAHHGGGGPCCSLAHVEPCCSHVAKNPLPPWQDAALTHCSRGRELLLAHAIQAVQAQCKWCQDDPRITTIC
jgi:hypothetical protein